MEVITRALKKLVRDVCILVAIGAAFLACGSIVVWWLMDVVFAK